MLKFANPHQGLANRYVKLAVGACFSQTASQAT